MLMKKTTRMILILIVLLLCAGLGFAAYRVQKLSEQETIAEAGSSEHADRPATSLTLSDGEELPLKKHISTLLVIGIDDIEGKAGPQPEDGLFYNLNLADFQTVLVFDDDAKTVTPVQLNRDTMAEVSWLSINGKIGGWETMQITFAHTYGSGGKDSCENCVRAVSRFLYGAPVDHYISFTMDAIPLLNDLVGGVQVTLEEDLPALGEEYTAGAEILLKGQAALRFVRYRDMSRTDANARRMVRHRQYLNAFIPAAREAVADNKDFVLDAFQALDSYLCMDMTVNDLSDAVNKLCEYEILPAVTYEGTYTQGEWAEFRADAASVDECVRSAFCS